MAVTPKPLIQGALLTASLVTLYTVPGATTAVFRSITFCNMDTVARTVTLHLVASGGAAGDANKILHQVSIPAGETLIDDTLRVLATGDFLRALASVANVVSIRADGSEVT